MTFSHSDPESSSADEIARILLEIDAIRFAREKPFTLTSGKPSPVYVDCRRIIAYPNVRKKIIDAAVEKIFREVGYAKIESIAGGETAGIPFAAWIADRMGLPMQYVRKKPKGFGQNLYIEGRVIKGAQTLLVEDLATDGGSKLDFINALRLSEMPISHCFVVFFYDIYPEARTKLHEAGVKIHYLATWRNVLRVLKDDNRLSQASLEEVEAFLAAPTLWQENQALP